MLPSVNDQEGLMSLVPLTKKKAFGRGDRSIVSEGRLIPRHRAILEMVIDGHDDKEIARLTEIGVSTVQAVKRSPAFVKEIEERRKGLIDTADEDRRCEKSRALDRLESMALKAVNKVEQVMDDDTAPPSVVLQASNSVLDRVFGGRGGNGPEGTKAPGGIINVEHAQILLVAMQESDQIDRG